MDVGCILAPAIYSCGAIASGPAVELNLLSDCSVELAVERLQLIETLASSILCIVRNKLVQIHLHTAFIIKIK